MKLIKETIRKKGEKSNFGSKILECNEISLDYAAENVTDDCSDEALFSYAEDYDKQHPIDEGNYIIINYLYKGSIKQKPTYFFGRGIQCKKQNGELIIINKAIG